MVPGYYGPCFYSNCSEMQFASVLLCAPCLRKFDQTLYFKLLQTHKLDLFTDTHCAAIFMGIPLLLIKRYQPFLRRSSHL